MSRNPSTAFTLAELLIALAILGVIATFTIPKILVAQQSSAYTSISKEAMALVSEAYQVHKLKGGVTSGTKFSDVTQYLNYVSVDTANTIDGYYGSATVSYACTSGNPCLLLHNGAKLQYLNCSFGSGQNPMLRFVFDPNGQANPDQWNEGRSMEILLYQTGMVRSRANLLVTSTDSCVSYGAGAILAPSLVPSWFNWTL